MLLLFQQSPFFCETAGRDVAGEAEPNGNFGKLGNTLRHILRFPADPWGDQVQVSNNQVVKAILGRNINQMIKFGW